MTRRYVAVGQDAFRVYDDDTEVGVTASRVFVATAAFTKAVVLSNAAVTSPLSGGRAAIFANATRQVEDVIRCEVVGVFAAKSDADVAVEKHRAANPDLGAVYEVVEVAVS